MLNRANFCKIRLLVKERSYRSTILQPNPISTEMWLKSHIDDIQHEANQYRAARLAAQASANPRTTRASPPRQTGWLRLLVARLTGA
jgi:hypothetical protein